MTDISKEAVERLAQKCESANPPDASEAASTLRALAADLAEAQQQIDHLETIIDNSTTMIDEQAWIKSRAEVAAAEARAESARADGYAQGVRDAADETDKQSDGWDDGISANCHPYTPKQMRLNCKAAILALIDQPQPAPTPDRDRAPERIWIAIYGGEIRKTPPEEARSRLYREYISRIGRDLIDPTSDERVRALVDAQEALFDAAQQVHKDGGRELARLVLEHCDALAALQEGVDVP